jgi:hypothetical protein
VSNLDVEARKTRNKLVSRLTMAWTAEECRKLTAEKYRECFKEKYPKVLEKVEKLVDELIEKGDEKELRDLGYGLRVDVTAILLRMKKR